MGVVLIVFMILAVVVSIFSLVAVIADLVRERKNAEQKVHSEPVDEKEGVSVSGELCVSAEEAETANTFENCLTNVYRSENSSEIADES